MTRPAVIGAALAVLLASGCARSLQQVQLAGGDRASIAELWQEPTDIARRDLFNGPGGAKLAPRDPTFTFVAMDTSGFSPGFDVRSADGLEWSVKLGPEAQSEVLESVQPADVRWACTLLSRLLDAQWRDAFRAGGYNAEQSVRYIAKIKAKIAQGLQLTSS